MNEYKESRRQSNPAFEQSGRAGLIPGRTPPLERHDKGLRT